MRRWAVLAVLGAVGGWAAQAVVTAGLAQVSFEPTDAARFKAWAARPLLAAGQGAAACCAAGVVSWFLARRRPRLLLVAAATAAAAAGLLAWGSAARAGRSHPEAARGRALAGVTLPPGFVDTGTHLDRPDAVTAPAATRTWTTSAGEGVCTDVEAGLAAWADHGSIRAASNRGGRCYWSATWHHHQVDVNVVPAGGATNVSVRLAGR